MTLGSLMKHFILYHTHGDFCAFMNNDKTGRHVDLHAISESKRVRCIRKDGNQNVKREYSAQSQAQQEASTHQQAAPVRPVSRASSSSRSPAPPPRASQALAAPRPSVYGYSFSQLSRPRYGTPVDPGYDVENALRTLVADPQITGAPVQGQPRAMNWRPTSRNSGARSSNYRRPG